MAATLDIHRGLRTSLADRRARGFASSRALEDDGFDPQLRPRRADLQEYILEGEAVVFDPRSQGLHLLNETALSVLRACDGRSTLRDLAEGLVKEYGIDINMAEDHVEQLVAAFASAGLLWRSPPHAD